MKREETIQALKNADSPAEIRQGDMLEWYYRHFSHLDDEQRARIFEKETRWRIGKAMKQCLEMVCVKIEDGKNNVAMPQGCTVYRERTSKSHQKWLALVPDGTPVERCKAIGKDLLGIYERVIEHPPQEDKRGDVRNEPVYIPADELPF